MLWKRFILVFFWKQNFTQPNKTDGRCGGLMVSVLDSETSNLGSLSLAGALRGVLEQHSLLLQCLSSPRCINLMLGKNLRWTSISFISTPPLGGDGLA